MGGGYGTSHSLDQDDANLALALQRSLDSLEEDEVRRESGRAAQIAKDSELASQLQAAEVTESRARARLEAQRAQQEASDGLRAQQEARAQRERANRAERERARAERALQQARDAQKARNKAYKLNSERNALSELASTRKALISVAKEAKAARDEARAREYLGKLFPLTPSAHTSGHWHHGHSGPLGPPGPYGNWDGASGPGGPGGSSGGLSVSSGASGASGAFYRMCAGAGANGVHKCTEAAMRAYPANVALSWHHETPPHSKKFSQLLSAVVGYWDPAPKSEYERELAEALHAAKVAQLHDDCTRHVKKHGAKGYTTVAEALGSCIFVWSDSKWRLYHSGADCSEGAVYIAEKNGRFTRLRPRVVTGDGGLTGPGGQTAQWGYRLGFGATRTAKFTNHVMKIGG